MEYCINPLTGRKIKYGGSTHKKVYLQIYRARNNGGSFGIDFGNAVQKASDSVLPFAQKLGDNLFKQIGINVPVVSTISNWLIDRGDSKLLPSAKIMSKYGKNSKQYMDIFSYNNFYLVYNNTNIRIPRDDNCVENIQTALNNGAVMGSIIVPTDGNGKIIENEDGSVTTSFKPVGFGEQLAYMIVCTMPWIKYSDKPESVKYWNFIDQLGSIYPMVGAAWYRVYIQNIKYDIQFDINPPIGATIPTKIPVPIPDYPLNPILSPYLYKHYKL